MILPEVDAPTVNEVPMSKSNIYMTDYSQWFDKNADSWASKIREPTA